MQGVSRTKVLCQILELAFQNPETARQLQDTLQDKTARQNSSDENLRKLRHDLDTTIERVKQIESVIHLQDKVQDRLQDKVQDKVQDKLTYTTSQLIERYGWNKSNAARSARSQGWIEVGKRGKEKLWARGD